MVVSNEPGYYEEGAFGIRIENLLIVKEAGTPFRFGEQPYLSFERLTMCPLQRKMIDLEVRRCGMFGQEQTVLTAYRSWVRL